MKFTAGAGRLFAIALTCGATVSLCGCDDGSDPKAQIGANPTLPPIHQYLLPPVHIARVVGWKQGENPLKQTDKPWEKPVEKEQNPKGVKKSDLERWQETDTH